MGEKALRRSEVHLDKVGLIHCRLSTNCRRFPLYEDHKISSAYGIDLTPIIALSKEMDDMITDMEVKSQARRALKAKIACTLQEYRRTLVGLGGSILTKIDAYIFEIRNVLRRKSTSIEEMQDIELQVEEYGDEIALSQGSITGVEEAALTDIVSVT